jgi:hypothetical protein
MFQILKLKLFTYRNQKQFSTAAHRAAKRRGLKRSSGSKRSNCFGETGAA